MGRGVGENDLKATGLKRRGQGSGKKLVYEANGAVAGFKDACESKFRFSGNSLEFWQKAVAAFEELGPQSKQFEKDLLESRKTQAAAVFAALRVVGLEEDDSQYVKEKAAEALSWLHPDDVAMWERAHDTDKEGLLKSFEAAAWRVRNFAPSEILDEYTKGWEEIVRSQGRPTPEQEQQLLAEVTGKRELIRDRNESEMRKSFGYALALAFPEEDDEDNEITQMMAQARTDAAEALEHEKRYVGAEYVEDRAEFVDASAVFATLKTHSESRIISLQSVVFDLLYTQGLERQEEADQSYEDDRAYDERY